MRFLFLTILLFTHVYARPLSQDEKNILTHFSVNHYNLGISLGDITQDEFEKLYLVFPEPLRTSAINNPNLRKKITYERYGLYQDLNSPMPYAFSKINKNVYRVNCLFCHGGTIPSLTGPEFYIGAPNTRTDVTAFFHDRINYRKKYRSSLSGAFRLDPVIFPAFERILTGINLNSNKGTPAVWKFSALEITTRESGMGLFGYSPTGLTNLLANRIDDYGVSVVDVDPLPWWNTRHKTHLWMDAWIPKDGRAFSVNIPGPFNNLKKFEKPLGDLVSLMTHIKVPKYPFDVDPAKSQAGKNIFENKCAGCHGVYLEDGSVKYPNKVIDIAIVGTDDKRLFEGMTQRYRQLVKDSWIGRFGKSDIKVNPKGYVAPPLRGVWASAPYLHNGSVPTLYEMLHMDERPNYWKSNPEIYDWGKVGLQVDRYDYLPSVLAPHELVEIFNTFNYGKSNHGHPFANDLYENEKEDVLEYLKTL